MVSLFRSIAVLFPRWSVMSRGVMELGRWWLQDSRGGHGRVSGWVSGHHRNLGRCRGGGAPVVLSAVCVRPSGRSPSPGAAGPGSPGERTPGTGQSVHGLSGGPGPPTL